MNIINQKSFKITLISFFIIYFFIYFDNLINNKNKYTKLKISYIFKLSSIISIYIFIILKYLNIDCKNIESQKIILTIPNF